MKRVKGSKKTIEDSKKFESSATPEQLATIKILADHHERLAKRGLLPLTNILLLFLPYLLPKGGYFHGLYLWLREKAGSPIQIPFKSSYERPLSQCFEHFALKTANLTRTQYTISTALAVVDQGVIETMQNTIISLGFSRTALRSIPCSYYIESYGSLLDDNRFSINVQRDDGIEGPREIILYPDQLKRRREEFVKTMAKITQLCQSPPDDAEFSGITSAYKKIGQNDEGQKFQLTSFIPSAIAMLPAKKIAQRIQVIVEQLIKEFKAEDTGEIIGQVATLTFLDMVTEQYTEPHLALATILCSLFVKHWIIYPPLLWGYRRVMEDKPSAGKYLSSSEAELIITRSREKNTRMRNYVTTSWGIFGLALPLLAFIVAVFYLMNNEISPELFIIGFSAIGSMLSEGYQVVKSLCAQRCLQQNLEEIERQLNLAVAATKHQWHVEQGSTTTESRCTFRAYHHPDQVISPPILKEIVALALHPYISILSGNKDTLVVPAFLLTHSTVQAINSQIIRHLEQLKVIKSLKGAIHNLFRGQEVIEMRKLIQNQMTATFIIHTHTLDAEKNIKWPDSILEACSIRREGSYLILELKDPSRLNLDELVELKPTYKNTLNKNPLPSDEDSQDAKSEEPPNPTEPSTIQRKTGRKIGDLSRHFSEESKESKTRILRWPGGHVYDGSKHCPVTPICHPVFAKSHFLVFLIPPACFSTEASYTAAVQKVREGRLAPAKGAQGLQFRSGIAEDHNGQTFRYDIRLKLLGGNGKGDMRLFGQCKETTDENHKTVFLYEIKGVQHHTH